MTASIQIKGNYYYINLRYKDNEGKWKTKTNSTHLTVSGNNKHKVEQMRINLLNEWKNKTLAGSSMLVSDFFEKWLKAVCLHRQ